MLGAGASAVQLDYSRAPPPPLSGLVPWFPEAINCRPCPAVRPSPTLQGSPNVHEPRNGFLSPTTSLMAAADIVIKGAREHNLRDVNLVLPRNQLICLTGVSGSG